MTCCVPLCTIPLNGIIGDKYIGSYLCRSTHLSFVLHMHEILSRTSQVQELLTELKNPLSPPFPYWENDEEVVDSGARSRAGKYGEIQLPSHIAVRIY